MGLQDRDYYQQELSIGIQAPKRGSAVFILLVLNTVVFFIDAFIPLPSQNASQPGEKDKVEQVSDGENAAPAKASKPVARSSRSFNDVYLALRFVAPATPDAAAALEGQTARPIPEFFRYPWTIYKVLGYGFAHADIQDGGIVHFLFNMLGLFFFGPPVEQKYGRDEFLRFFLISILLGGLAWLGVGFATGLGGGLVGASAGVVAITILFILDNPKATILLMFIPTPAWIAGCLIICLNIVGATQATSRIAYSAHLGGIAFAFLYARANLNLNWIPAWLFNPTKWVQQRQPQLTIHDPDADEADYGARDAEADRVLAKLHESGEDSLNRRERKVLEDYSRRMRQKHR